MLVCYIRKVSGRIAAGTGRIKRWKHDRPENNKDNSVAITSLNIASEINKVANPENQ